MNKYKTSCRYFQGDRPCKFHKNEGIYCDGCSNFESVEYRILIIKLAAIGDVLRTTSILPALKKKYPKSSIIWVTKKEAMDLMEGNPYVDLLLEYPNPAINRLWIEKFDVIINLDCDFESASLATIAKGVKKLGFGCSDNAALIPFNDAAEYWLEMSLFDDVKKRNTKTYQQIMLDICELDPKENNRPRVYLKKEELQFTHNFIKTHGIDQNVLTIGLNPGAGSRWQQKRWKPASYVDLINRIKEKYTSNIILSGGPGEVELNSYLLEKTSHRIINAGCGNTCRQFAGLVSACDIVITGDTLALHLAVALGKRIVAIFGPTSMSEIDLYGQGDKVSSEMDCLCCYKSTCNKPVTCMDMLTVEKVFASVENQIKEISERKRKENGIVKRKKILLNRN